MSMKVQSYLYFSNYFKAFYRLVCPGLLYAQTLHKPSVLLSCECLYLALFPWPLEAAALQPLIQQDKAIPFPVQSLYPVTPSPAEKKQRICEWVKHELLLYQRGQTVYAAAKVRIPAGYVYLLCSCEICQHSFSARTMAQISSLSAPWWISTLNSPDLIVAAAIELLCTGISTNTGFDCSTVSSNSFRCQ